MFLEVFDKAPMFAMRLAIEQIMEEMGVESDAQITEIAHVVFIVASSTGEFDPTALAKMARERLADGATSKPKS